VFGSVARDEQTGQSDIDLLVEFSKPGDFVTFMRLENFLSERLGKQVDLVTPEFLKPVKSKKNIFSFTGRFRAAVRGRQALS
jgi:hypothetical protein